jgi:hypothetical protein
MDLRELQIYRLKVGLFAYRYGEKAGLLDTHGLVHAGSHVWLDQVTPDGWAVFGLFNAEGGGFLRGLYVKCPVEITDDQVEEVRGEDGQPAMVLEKATT